MMTRLPLRRAGSQPCWKWRAACVDLGPMGIAMLLAWRCLHQCIHSHSVMLHLHGHDQVHEIPNQGSREWPPAESLQRRQKAIRVGRATTMNLAAKSECVWHVSTGLRHAVSFVLTLGGLSCGSLIHRFGRRGRA